MPLTEILNPFTLIRASPMILKNILKTVLNYTGYNIQRYKKAVPVINVVEPPSEEVVNPDEQRLLYYAEEGKRFQWLKDFNFKTIIDVGANEGQFAGKVLSVFPNALIHCFEPLTTAFSQLKIYFDHLPNVVLYNYGLGVADDEKMIFKNEYSPSSSLLEMLDLHKSNFDFAVNVVQENISIRKLDDFFKTTIARPLLLKIDVQGYEKYVLDGGESVLQQADLIIIETSFYPLYSGQPLFDEIYQYLTKLEFQYAGNVEQLIAPIDKKILQADAIFIRKGNWP